MSPAPGSFVPWLEDVAPGIPEPSRIARDKILYRSAEERPRRTPAFSGDSMDVDMEDGLRMPIENVRNVWETEP